MFAIFFNPFRTLLLKNVLVQHSNGAQAFQQPNGNNHSRNEIILTSMPDICLHTYAHQVYYEYYTAKLR